MVLVGVVRGCGVVVTTVGFLRSTPQFWLRSGYILLVALLLAGDVDCSPTPALFEEGDHATPLPRSTLPCSSSTILFWFPGSTSLFCIYYILLVSLLFSPLPTGQF